MARAGVKTKRKQVWLTEDVIQLVNAEVERHAANGVAISFSAALEMATRKGLGQPLELALAPILASAIHQAAQAHFRAYRKLSAVAAREAGIAARMSTLAVRLAVHERALEVGREAEVEARNQSESKAAVLASDVTQSLKMLALKDTIATMRKPLEVAGLLEPAAKAAKTKV